jgi:hypothetical protein
MPSSQTDADAAAVNIREIVAMVKSGKINKSDAFNELRHLLKHSNTTRSQPMDDNNDTRHAGTEDNDNNNNNNNSMSPPPNPSDSIDFTPGHQKTNSSATSLPSSQSRFSKEDRRILINTLIEKKRRDRMQQSNIMDDDDDDDDNSLDRDHYDEEGYDEGYDDNNYPEHARMEYNGEDDMSSDDHRRGEMFHPPPSYEDMSRSSNQQEQGFGLNFQESNMDASSISSSGIRSRGSRERPRSAGRMGGSGKQNFRSVAFSGHRANDDSRLSDFRAQKGRMAESATRAEMFKECTFEPKIKDLPSSYGSNNKEEKDAHFYDRVMRWQREKEIEATRRKTLSSHNEVVDCTFQPRISKNSQRSVKMTRGADCTKKDTPSRLYESNSQSIFQKARSIEEQHQRELEEASRECTFQPK